MKHNCRKCSNKTREVRKRGATKEIVNKYNKYKTATNTVDIFPRIPVIHLNVIALNTQV